MRRLPRAARLTFFPQTQRHVFGYVCLWAQTISSRPYVPFFFFFLWPLSVATFHISKSQHGSAEHKRLCSCSGKPSMICFCSAFKQSTAIGLFMQAHFCYLIQLAFLLPVMRWQVWVSSPALKHPVPTSLKAWPLDRRPPHHQHLLSLWSFPPPLYLPFICLSLNPHWGPTAHFQRSASPASADQSQEAASRSIKHAVCFSAGYKLPQRKTTSV